MQGLIHTQEVAIIKNSLKVQKKTELRPYIGPSTNILHVSNENIEHYTRSEYLVLINYILRKNANHENSSHFEEIKDITNILKMILRKYHAKIIYSLFKINFASKHFLKKKAGLRNHDWVDKLFADLESYSIVRKIERTDEDYNVKIKFWQSEFKNTHTKKNVDLYRITNEFLPVIEAFSRIIEKRYFSILELRSFQRFNNNYEKYSTNVKERLAQIRSDNKLKLGNCIECKKIVFKSEKKGKGGYHLFNAGLVCDKCKINLLRIKRKEWIRKNK